MGSFDYSHWTNSKIACLECRKSYVKSHEKCPDCGGELKYIGTHFQAPKRRDIRAWKAVKMLHNAGIRFGVYDSHKNGWTKLYDSHGELFNRSDLWQVLAENGIGSKDTSKWHWDSNFQFMGKRPKNPRYVPAYIEQWQQKRLHRIVLVYEVCTKLGWTNPPIESDIHEQVMELLEVRSTEGYAETQNIDDETTVILRLREEKKRRIEE